MPEATRTSVVLFLLVLGVGILGISWFGFRTQRNIKLQGFQAKLKLDEKEMLDEGGFGTVYRVEDHDGNEYALKILKNEVTAEAMKEIEILSEFRHENIVQFYDYRVKHRKLHILMELMSGSVASFIRQEKEGRLEESEAKKLMKQVMKAVEYLHEHGIIHRDIRCDNILLDRDLNAKLADMGIAQYHGLEKTGKCYMPGFFENTGAFWWMSPEVLKGECPPGKRSDIWMVGATAWEMVKGYPPFKHLGPLATDAEYRKLVDNDKDLSNELKDFLMKIFVRLEVRPYAPEVAAHAWLQ